MKSTRRWCGGVVGREHIIEIAVPPDIPGYIKDDCHWLKWREDYYLCHHYGICTECGKLMDRAQPEECPDYTGK